MAVDNDLNPAVKTFQHLPIELLQQIAGYLPSARDVVNLSKTCRSVHQAIETGAWKFFIAQSFPSTEPTSSIPFRVQKGKNFDKDAAKFLTAISRSWDRRAFVQRRVFAPKDTLVSDFDELNGLGRCIDSYLELTGGDWATQREVLCYGSGPRWTIRIRDQVTHKKGNDDDHNSVKTRTRWLRQNPSEDMAHGSNDVTALTLLRPQQKSYAGNDDEELIYVTPKAGIVHTLVIPSAKPGGNEWAVHGHKEMNLFRYETKKKGDRPSMFSLDWPIAVGPDQQPLLSSVHSKKNVAIFKVQNKDTASCPVGETSVIRPQLVFLQPMDTASKGNESQIWTMTWLTSNLLATGVGPDYRPICIFDVTGKRPDVPVRRFGSITEDREGYLDPTLQLNPSMSSVYAISVLPPEFAGAGGLGNVFLSGATDGAARLHDMRDPNPRVGKYEDPIDSDNGIYSLAVFGRERVVIGSRSNGTIKIFDLRMNRKAYDYRHALVSTRQPHFQPSLSTGWNVFCSPRRPSPVHCLSVPAAFGPTLYIGLDGSIQEHTVMSVVQERKVASPASCAISPQMYAGGPATRRGGRTAYQQVHSPQALLQDSQRPVLCLKYYEQTSFESGVKIRLQRTLEATRWPKPRALVDERWTDSAWKRDGSRVSRPSQWHRGRGGRRLN